MLTLVSSNAAKYAPFAADLERLRITLEPPRHPLPELQVSTFHDGLEAKARAAAQMFERPVLVDDTGLVLEAYEPFPGPLTAVVLRSLGVAGLQRLLAGVSNRADMECHLGVWIGQALRSWSGKVTGRLDFSRAPRDGKMILSDLFVPDGPQSGQELPHRGAALRAFEADAFKLHLDLAAAEASAEEAPCTSGSGYECPFCAEFDGESQSVFRRMMGKRLESRVVYEDDWFVVMPPLGEFIEGGLLLLTREHIPSFAYLPPDRFRRLEQLLAVIGEALVERWGVAPLVFEHGPARDRTKGVCCVDHAHLNIFPAVVRIHPHLAGRMNQRLNSLNDFEKLRYAEFGYLFVQENDRERRAYDGQSVPTQLVRRIVTQSLGLPERWHWQDYPGCEELAATYHALKDRMRL